MIYYLSRKVRNIQSVLFPGGAALLLLSIYISVRFDRNWRGRRRWVFAAAVPRGQAMGIIV